MIIIMFLGNNPEYLPTRKDLDGYEYDYKEPYFEPANEEEDLVIQLNTKLAITEIPRESLE
jgi:hypothetical protein